jgi:hypothetical protein
MTASGKIQKYKLRDMAKEQLGIEIGVFSGQSDADETCQDAGAAS